MTPNYAGQIVRINLENFMSYDNIEIHPGYNLNLVIGPNGTGKSSIVCAVLLCLGGKLKSLGRADQLGSYVKSGCNQSCIEVELYDPSSCNVVIKRKILAGNHSEFTVNGKPATAAKINEIRKKFNIQIDNLCTFLPQEKVQDFAKLNSQQLLDQTQKTIGDGNLASLYENLKELQAKTVNQEKHCEVLQIQLEKEVQKNERLKDQVKCFKERQILVDMLTVLNQKIAWLNYQNEIENKKEIDKDTKLAESVYLEKKKGVDKFDRELLKLNEKINSQEQELKQMKKNESGKEAAMQDRLHRAERRLDELDDVKNSVKTKLQEEEEKKKELDKYKVAMEKLTNDLKNLDISVGTETSLKAQMNEADERLRKFHEEENRLTQTKFNLEESDDVLKQEARNVANECHNLKQRQNMRLEYLKKHEPDVYKSMEWLEKNKHLFQSRIYRPMLLELDVPNAKMAKFIEARIGYKDLISFSCTNADDLNLLVQKLRGEQKWKVNVICSDECDSTQYLAETPISDLRSYGFYAYMKDFITGPEDIIRFLCKTYKIHCIPIGDDRVKANCEKIPPNIPLFYSENHVFTVKYSVYSGDKSINVRKLGDAKFFAESLDTGRIELLVNRGREIDAKMKKNRSEIEAVDREINDLRTRLEAVKKEKRRLATSAQERELIQVNLKMAGKKLKVVSETLKDPAEIEAEGREQEKAIKRDVQKNFADLRRISDDHANATLLRQKIELKCRLSKLSKTQVMEEKNRCAEEVSRKEELFREMKERQRAAEYKCRQLKDKAKQLTNNISMEDKRFSSFREAFSKLPETIDELEIELERNQTRSEFLQGGNIQVLHEYERREEIIVQMTADLETNRRHLEEKKVELRSRRDEWLTPVQNLVSNINVNFGKFFEAMGCAGEVCLVSGENEDDLESYGIKVKVKFRDGTPLEELGRHFQSGGERAVATAIFMLSLQELTSVPFRFVDEINQGMDPLNERRILQLMVQVTSGRSSSQYFVITPKLLPEIECSRTMTVHCIHNGPKAIPSSEWNMKRFLQRTEDEEEEEEED